MTDKGPIVFVVGAGASKDFGSVFPLGSDLATRIEHSLNVEFEETAKPALTGPICTALTRSDVDFSDAVAAAHRIRRGLSAQNSIDDYLNEWRGDAAMSLVAKAAIALCISKAERASDIAGNNMSEETIRRAVSASMKTTWLGHVLQNIKPPTIHKRKVRDILADVGFIVFNYDRCIEHFLYWSVRNMADMDDAAAQQVLDEIPIIHPYGRLASVGVPRERRDEANWLGFGAIEDCLPELCQGIRTYTEEQADTQTDKQIKALLSKARDVVFLGFSYHPQNMNLLFGESCSDDRNYWGACEHHDKERIARVVNQLMIAGPGAQNRLTELSCLEFVKRHLNMLRR